MEKIDELIILFDYYAELFTDKQKIIFGYYYFDNLSLTEISENLGISRNAVHKTIKIVESKLYEYECKLKLYDKRKKIIKILNDLRDENIKSQIIKNV